MKRKIKYILLCISSILAFLSCKKDNSLESPENKSASYFSKLPNLTRNDRGMIAFTINNTAYVYPYIKPVFRYSDTYKYYSMMYGSIGVLLSNLNGNPLFHFYAERSHKFTPKGRKKQTHNPTFAKISWGFDQNSQKTTSFYVLLDDNKERKTFVLVDDEDHILGKLPDFKGALILVKKVDVDLQIDKTTRKVSGYFHFTSADGKFQVKGLIDMPYKIRGVDLPLNYLDFR